jgi:hypothetical protein
MRSAFFGIEQIVEELSKSSDFGFAAAFPADQPRIFLRNNLRGMVKDRSKNYELKIGNTVFFLFSACSPCNMVRHSLHRPAGSS